MKIDKMSVSRLYNVTRPARRAIFLSYVGTAGFILACAVLVFATMAIRELPMRWAWHAYDVLLPQAHDTVRRDPWFLLAFVLAVLLLFSLPYEDIWRHLQDLTPLTPSYYDPDPYFHRGRRILRANDVFPELYRDLVRQRRNRRRRSD